MRKIVGFLVMALPGNEIELYVISAGLAKAWEKGDL